MIRRGYKRIARISSIQDGYLSMNASFDAQNEGRVKVALNEDFPPADKDFRSYLSKLRRLQAVDAVMVNLLPGQCGAFVKQLREMGVKLPVFGFETFEDIKEVQASNYTLVGAWYVNNDDPGEAFFREYQAVHPGATVWGAGNAYDTILLAAEGLQKSRSREGLNAFLHTVRNFRGSLGVYSASGDNRFTLPAAIKQVTWNGAIKLAGSRAASR
jgi:ABC-type branched-subunit amino acid transport system substrate-binding protein